MRNTTDHPAIAPRTPVSQPRHGAVDPGGENPDRVRLLAFTLLTWFAMLGALLGNAAAFMAPSMASHLAASPLQQQRLAGLPGAPRLSRRDGSPGAVVASRAVAAEHVVAGSSDGHDGAAAWPEGVPTLAALALPAAMPAVAEDAPRPSLRRRAHLSRAPPASA